MAQIVGLPRRIGNSETDALVSFVTYDARDRLLTESTGEVTLNYGYNANGSLTTKHEGSVLQSEQVWDVRGRLAGMKDGSGNWLSQYRYTPEGTRSAVTEGGTTTLYVVDALSPSGYAQVIEERTAAGVVVGSYVYGPALDPLSQWRDGQGANLHLADGHSGVRQAVSLAGVVLLAQRFDAYGVTVASAGTLANVIGYRGERFNGTLGQYYLRARFYNPMSGRFTGMDPFAGNYGDPLQAMRYGYAGANPVGAMDPSGMVSFGVTLGIGVALLAGLTTSYLTGIVSAPQSAPGFGESLIPFWGSGKSYLYHLSRGEYGMAALSAAFFVTDVFLLRSVVTSIARVGWKGTFTPGAVELVRGQFGRGYNTSLHYMWRVRGELFDVLKSTLIPKVRVYGKDIPKLFKEEGVTKLYAFFPELAKSVSGGARIAVPGCNCIAGALIYWDRGNGHLIAKSLLLWFPNYISDATGDPNDGDAVLVHEE